MAEPGNTRLGRMLLDDITPVVMVLRTPLVEECCRKNGLSLIEMLAPFCNFDNIDVPVRTASDQPYRLRKFRLRLFYAPQIRQQNIEVAKARLKQVITLAGDISTSELFTSRHEIDAVQLTSEQELAPSWFQDFNKELIDAASFSEHEAFDHPVACLLVVSSKDKDPIDKYVDLFNTNELPSLLNDGAMDPKILKYFLLLNDNQDDLSEKSTGIFTEMRSTFGANDCRFLCINSASDGSKEQRENPWASYIEGNTSENIQPVGLLNGVDMEELRSTMQDFTSKHIIPHMEQKIRVLNQQVSATRKGFRNQIKNLWWRKGKEDVPDSSKETVYTFSSIESQIRVLGDYAFMLRDYELALSNYRLISTDYKLDKAWKRYAGVQEMMGLAYFMLDQSRKDAEFCMENAFSSYLKTGSLGLRNATRCGLWWAEMLKARDRYKDAAEVLFRISGEEPLHSAVMLEQASYCYLLSKPTMLRKYGFHLVLSGDLYNKSGQIKHAIRTYRGALSVFKDSTWSHIRNHVYFRIGKWYGALGMSDEAFNHMLEVLACAHQSKATQELFLGDFFRTVQETGKTFEVVRLQLPVINFPLTRVVFEDSRTFGSPAAASITENLWQSLEEDMIPALSVMKTNWLDSQPKVLPKKYTDTNVCVAGEAIKVDVSYSNHLQIPISISNVSLICQHSAESDEHLSDASGSLVGHQDTDELRTVSGDFSLDTPFFTLSEVASSMRGGESISVQLTVTPKIEGTLKVVGVRWKLFGSVVGICNFNIDVMRKKVPREKRKQKPSVENKLEFLVIQSLPRLEGVIKNLPETVYAGDLRCLTLELTNRSKISVKNLKMMVSHPRFIGIADQEVLSLEFPTCLRKQENSLQWCKKVDSTKEASNVILFPEGTTISVDKPLVWPLWFRAAATGSILLCITIYYEIQDRSAVIAYRTLRMLYNLEVLPYLEMSFGISPCPSRGQEFLVQMEVINKTSSESFQIHQLSCVGQQWELALLGTAESDFPLGFLMPGQAFSHFFKLKKCRKQIAGEDSVPGTSGKSDITFDDGDSRVLFDTSISPLLLFHNLERLVQERPEQEYESTVDFILISESRSSNDPGLPGSSEIYSHHKCHCRIASMSPISWLMDGPRTVMHDFTTGLCEINLSITVFNFSQDVVSIHVNTVETTPAVNSVSSSSSASGNEVGWHDLSHVSELKVTSDIARTRVSKSPAFESVLSFIWSESSSIRVDVEPESSTEVPLQICVFAPGTFDLSNYSLHWNFMSSSHGVGDVNGSRVSAGTCQGYSYHITVLQNEKVGAVQP